MRRADIISGADESDLFAFREWKKMNKDLFEEVALRIGCRYVSDMRDEPFRRFAKETLAQSIDLGEYPLGVLRTCTNIFTVKELISKHTIRQRTRSSYKKMNA